MRKQGSTLVCFPTIWRTNRRFSEKFVIKLQKSKFSKVKKPQIFTEQLSIISAESTIFYVYRLPKSFSLVLAKNSSPDDFLKNDKAPKNIHPRNKCAKFQSNLTIFYKLSQSFSDRHVKFSIYSIEVGNTVSKIL